MNIKFNYSGVVNPEQQSYFSKVKYQFEEALKKERGNIEFQFIQKYGQFNLVKNEFMSYQKLRSLLSDQIKCFLI
ncbi:hypothetical protein M2T82_09160 [Elizabethkingia ursingii]|uniref:hypothetical protein n=1 Tax=Elizabethkingia ursingii TaxID=1756150 RepID=UPI00201220FE|nr:hypothetical protein [Elizabethkingia ursingii]MCL1668226.1 hypothetical protein [Elizabethkingia ursingii]